MYASPRPKYHFVSHGMTDKGNVRDHNEDAFLDAASEGLWVVADGVGGHDRGEVASSMIVQELATLKRQAFLGEWVTQVDACLQRVNNRLITMRSQPGSRGIIGSTVCVLLIHERHYVCAWAGDSRIYLWRYGKLFCLTHDHNRMDEFVRAGFSEEDVSKYPAARQLVRAVGVASPLLLEKQLQECCAGDVFLLCSDGLSEELEDGEISTFLQMGTSPQNAIQKMIQAVLSRRARDNVTALLVQVNELSS